VKYFPEQSGLKREIVRRRTAEGFVQAAAREVFEQHDVVGPGLAGLKICLPSEARGSPRLLRVGEGFELDEVFEASEHLSYALTSARREGEERRKGGMQHRRTSVIISSL
jgi:hypothetical protein